MTPGTRDISTVVGDFTDVADLIHETAIKAARAVEATPEAGKVAAD